MTQEFTLSTGRKLRPAVARDKLVQLRFSEDELRELDEMSKMLDMPRSHMIRACIEHAVPQFRDWMLSQGEVESCGRKENE